MLPQLKLVRIPVAGLSTNAPARLVLTVFEAYGHHDPSDVRLGSYNDVKV